MNVIVCRRCGGGPLRRQVHGGAGVPVAQLLSGRGLCGVCYGAERRAGGLVDWERSTWPAEDLVADAELLRAKGLLWREVAAQLGVKKGSLEAARRRARQRSRVAA